MPCTNDPERLDRICRRIADGRRLDRRLSSALREHPFSESEFRLLWLMRRSATSNQQGGVEQKSLAESLGISPAQVSALVERLRRKKALVPIADNKDRRRQLWQLTAGGHKQLDDVAIAVGLQSLNWELASEHESLTQRGNAA